MNLQILNQSVSRNIEELYPRITQVFDTVIHHAVTTGRSVNVKSFIKRLNTQLQGQRVRVTREQIGRAHV